MVHIGIAAPRAQASRDLKRGLVQLPGNFCCLRCGLLR